MTEHEVKKHLMELAADIADELSDTSTDPVEFVENALGIETVCRFYHGGQVKNVELSVALGGPTVRVHSGLDTIIATWGSERVEISYFDNCGLFDVLETIVEDGKNG